MSKKNDDFFKEKKTWSEVKDELLGCYLKPYIQKVLNTRKPIVYVDCFAGKGMFEDGKAGSPIIALGTIKGCLELTQVKENTINPYFIDLNYSEELKRNIAYYKIPDENVVGGKYEEEIEKILSKNEGSNLFLYIDPYCIFRQNSTSVPEGRHAIPLQTARRQFGFAFKIFSYPDHYIPGGMPWRSSCLSRHQRRCYL